jgi:ABC-2 type transport system ATP-binding protein
VDEMIELVGLASVANKRAGGYSLGMGQRLGIAAALLGDPEVVLFDEPVNGLDPEGIQWVRELLRSLAKQGRTVFVSSHLMSEMALTADHVIVIGRGKLLEDADIGEMIAKAGTSVSVRSPDATRLAEVLARSGGTVHPQTDGALLVTDLDAVAIGEAAAREGIVLHELAPQRASLEEAFIALTKEHLEFGHAT